MHDLIRPPEGRFKLNMRYKTSILNIASGLFILAIIFYTIFNYKQLSNGEGWGIVAMTGLICIPVLLLVIDLIIQQIFKDRMIVNIIGIFLTVASILLVVLK